MQNKVDNISGASVKTRQEGLKQGVFAELKEKK
jgi:hypothetical protein